ncbi:energy transducer TonB [Campylobacter ureolyticus]|uniref:Energy transducer TonB n=1 Tax=Campylobacter ureolyticus TaxID=827 RepID=A0A2I1NA66_9BACT|nr:energy transducer TonB [Campylobacter ureolyticus]MCZ6111421.1 TonB family protein [Campylobacter ureolyticus]MDU7070367.1 TonB family protein [Campylobacter ureolyticus]PKZ29284.1 energy transducer TonB [Campylobacter ureolyticus]
MRNRTQKNSLIFGVILSLMLHFLVLFLFLHRPYKPSLSGGYGGEIGEFESIMIISDLPLGELREVSIDSVKAMQNYEAMPEINEAEVIKTKTPLDEMDEVEVVTSISALEIPSEVEVIKAQNLAPKIAKPKEQKQKPKKNVKKEKIPKKADEKKPISNISGEVNSVAKDNFASAPVKGSGTKVSSPGLGSGKSKNSNWQGLVMAHLNKFKKYPKNSLINEEEGKVVLRVKIDKNGNVLSLKMRKSSKFESLNNEALKLFKDASPLPKPPIDLIKGKSSIILNMPIEYDIKKYLQSR